MRAAEKLRLPEKSQKRLDLRDLFTVTIDGEDAKDLDDAISVSLLPNNHFELWVHIADVAEYIRENDPIDIEAQKRGTSIYLPDRVIPMLPERLSNDLCSLHPGTPKLTLSIRMELDETAQVIDRSIHETIIESDHRLTYTFVADVLEKNALKSSRMNVIPDLIRDLDFIHEATSGHKIGSIEQNRNILNQVQNDKLLSLIQNAARLKKLLDIRRKKEGKIDFDLPELKILMAPDGRVSDVKKRERNEAHKIIEEFMVLANEEISKYFATKKIPFLYRTHETPGDLALQKLASIAGQYGHPFNPEKPKPRDIQIFLENIKAKPYEYHIARLTLQSMARAQYSDLLLGHYGLALYYYSHFTSPIRRYPDLQIHRIIKEFLRNELNETRLEHYRKKLKNIAIGCSNSERQAE
jgi:ribonuclease R